jgi:hypothetical protein
MFLARIRERIRAIIFTGIVALFFFICGAVMAFVMAPEQETDWRRIESLPELDASTYAATSSGEEVVITGKLQGNQAMTRHELAAYRVDKWGVRSDDDGRDEGRWLTVEVNVPALAISINGGTIKTAPASSPAMSGNLHEFIELANSSFEAAYHGQSLPDGSLRTQGFRNGDWVTVVGSKASTGDLRPDRLYAGDRAQLVDDIRFDVRALRVIGIAIMVCGPLLLAISVGWAAFGRRTG